MKIILTSTKLTLPVGSVLDVVSYYGSSIIARFNDQLITLLPNKYSSVYSNTSGKTSNSLEVTSEGLTLTMVLPDHKKRHVEQIRDELGRVYRIDLKRIE